MRPPSGRGRSAARQPPECQMTYFYAWHPAGLRALCRAGLRSPLLGPAKWPPARHLPSLYHRRCKVSPSHHNNSFGSSDEIYDFWPSSAVKVHDFWQSEFWPARRVVNFQNCTGPPPVDLLEFLESSQIRLFRFIQERRRGERQSGSTILRLGVISVLIYVCPGA